MIDNYGIHVLQGSCTSGAKLCDMSYTSRYFKFVIARCICICALLCVTMIAYILCIDETPVAGII